MAAAAVERNPEESGTHLGLGRALLLAGRPAEAAERLALAARMNPRDPESRSLLGVLELGAGRGEAAAGLFREAIVAARGRGAGVLQGGVPGEGDTAAGLDPDRAPTGGELRAAAGLFRLGEAVGGSRVGGAPEGSLRERLRAVLEARGTGEALLDLDGDGEADGAAVEAGGTLAVALLLEGGGVELLR